MSTKGKTVALGTIRDTVLGRIQLNRRPEMVSERVNFDRYRAGQIAAHLVRIDFFAHASVEAEIMMPYPMPLSIGLNTMRLAERLPFTLSRWAQILIVAIDLAASKRRGARLSALANDFAGLTGQPAVGCGMQGGEQ